MKTKERKHKQKAAPVQAAETNAAEEAVTTAAGQPEPEPETETATETAQQEAANPEPDSADTSPEAAVPEAGENAEAAEEPSASEETPAATPDIDALIAEAEQRGYLRGRNESIAELMRRPAMMQTITPEPAPEPEPDNEPMILRHRRISIWDR